MTRNRRKVTKKIARIAIAWMITTPRYFAEKSLEL
jgi:hypothetical protein